MKADCAIGASFLLIVKPLDDKSPTSDLVEIELRCTFRDKPLARTIDQSVSEPALR